MSLYHSLRSDIRERIAAEFIAKTERRYTDVNEIIIEHDYVDAIARLG